MNTEQHTHEAALLALSPLDGRYADVLFGLKESFSEGALIKARCQVEVEWLIKLLSLPPVQQTNGITLSTKSISTLRSLIDNFDQQSALKVKDYETTTKHDVKAVEYFIKDWIRSTKDGDLETSIEWLHFGCTSEDINSVAYSLLLKRGMTVYVWPALLELLGDLLELTETSAGMPMLALTHGQPATPTTFGKEMGVFAARVFDQLERSVNQIVYRGKYGGAVGNYNAHMVALPAVDWPAVCREFVEALGITYQPFATQIENRDAMAELFDALKRINSILLGFVQDMWTYISRERILLKPISGEVGSSTMPHKINPIDFENAEGNLGLANALLIHLSSKLTVSRMQRDLSDSTVLRNIGVALGHCLVAYRSITKGLKKITVNQAGLLQELNRHWEILAEPIQMVLRRAGVEGAYELLKDLTRGRKKDGQTITESDINRIIAEAHLTDEDKNRLLELSPETYVGAAQSIAFSIVQEIGGKMDGVRHKIAADAHLVFDSSSGNVTEV